MFGRHHSPATPPMGLIVAGKETKLPLKKVSVTAHQNGYLVGLKSTLQYNNDTEYPLEVLFRFPVDESFAVVGLEAVIGGRKIKAVVKEKEEAKQMYDDAMASGFTAALGEEQTGDIFSISLGNLPPKSEAQLNLSLAGELPIDAEGAVRFTLPAVLKPRYTPSGSKDPLAHVSGAPGQAQHGSTSAVFDFSMTVANADTVKKVSSPTHTVATETKSGLVHVTLKDATPLNKDLVIQVEYSDPHEPKAIPEPGDRQLSQQKYMGSPTVMLNFFPQFETKRAACEFIFLIDRSGSMSGSYIKSAGETLALFLKSIPPGCSFNVIGFGSSYRLLFSSSAPYDQTHLDAAIQHAETVKADLGGTELLSPLRNIFEQQALLPGLPRQVFVLTDGSVSNTHACIQLVRKNAKIARVFTFGIGSGASTELVKGLARAGNGTAEFIKEGERMQPKVISSLKRALQPAVTDLEVEFDVPSGFQALLAPTKLPTLFNGDKVVIYGIIKSKASSNEPLNTSVQGTATLRGKVVGKNLEYKISFEIPEPVDSEPTFDLPIIHQLASKSLIVDWQNKEGWSASATEEERKKEIIDLSVESSVVSSHTAYIAVDEDQDKPIEGAVKVWDLTAGMVTQDNMYGIPCMGFSSAPRQYSTSSSGGAFMGSLGGGSLGAPPPPPGGAFGGSLPPVNPSVHYAAPMLRRAAGGPPPPPAAPAYNRYAQEAYSPPPMQQQQQQQHFDRLPFNSGPPMFTRGVVTGFPLTTTSESRSLADDLFFDDETPMEVDRMGGPPPAPMLQPQRSAPLARQADFSRSFEPKPSSSSSVTSTGLNLLISLQKAEGFWQLETLATNFLHKPVGDLTSKCPAGCSNEVWATLIAMAYLESKFSSQQDEWELVNMKAEFWLQTQQLPSDIASLKEAAKKCF